MYFCNDARRFALPSQSVTRLFEFRRQDFTTIALPSLKILSVYLDIAFRQGYCTREHPLLRHSSASLCSLHGVQI